MTSWKENLVQDTGSEYFSNFNINMYSEITGDEIFFDPTRTETTMSPFFFGIWKSKNKNIETMINNGVVMTSLSIAGKTYPVYIRLICDFSPLVLGQDFFTQFKWSHNPGENIKTPMGEIIVDQDNYEGKSIDVKLVQQVFRAEEIGREKKKVSRKQQLTKLHKYFGHASAENMWRVIKNLSNKEEFKLAEIKEIYDECEVCHH